MIRQVLVLNRTKTVRRLGFLVLVVALVVVGYFGVLTVQNKMNAPKLINPEITSLIKQIGMLIELPQGEMPQLATVTDAETIKKDQAFFVNSQNGDKVLIYPTAGKAIIYRPGANKIIEVGPVTINVAPPNPST